MKISYQNLGEFELHLNQGLFNPGLFNPIYRLNIFKLATKFYL